jgi:hypothetical protein
MKLSFIISINFLFVESLEKPKLCINCKHFIPYIDRNIKIGKFGKCKLFKKDQLNSFLVDGIDEYDDDYYYCSTSRRINDMCGILASHYEPNNQTGILIEEQLILEKIESNYIQDNELRIRKAIDNTQDIFYSAEFVRYLILFFITEYLK